jgi:hypothetical protein
VLGQCIIIAMENEGDDNTNSPINHEKTWPIVIMQLSTSRSHQCLNPNCCCCLLKNGLWHNLLGQCIIIAIQNEADDNTNWKPILQAYNCVLIFPYVPVMFEKYKIVDIANKKQAFYSSKITMNQLLNRLSSLIGKEKICQCFRHWKFYKTKMAFHLRHSKCCILLMQNRLVNYTVLGNKDSSWPNVVKVYFVK